MEVHAVQCIYFIIKKSTDPLLIDHGVQSQNDVWKSEVELISPLQKHFSQSFGHAIIHSCEHGLRHTQPTSITAALNVLDCCAASDVYLCLDI